MAREIPIFEGTEMEKLVECIKWAKRNVLLKRWKNEQIERFFSKRSPNKILESGHTVYMNNCLDRTLVLMQALKKNNLQPTMVAELLEVKGIKAPHFAVELNLEGKPFFAHFITKGLAAVLPGNYVPYKAGQRNVTSLATYRIPGKHFTMRNNFFQAVKGATAESGVARVDMRIIIEKMKRDNTLETYRTFGLSRRAPRGKKSKTTQARSRRRKRII